MIEVRPEGATRIWLRYDDGVSGAVDLSEEIAKGGVFADLGDASVFGEARLGEYGQVEWPGGAELCGDALYMRLTGQSPDQIFPGLSHQSIDA